MLKKFLNRLLCYSHDLCINPGLLRTFISPTRDSGCKQNRLWGYCMRHYNIDCILTISDSNGMFVTMKLILMLLTSQMEACCIVISFA
jgi:hypothetical protein